LPRPVHTQVTQTVGRPLMGYASILIGTAMMVLTGMLIRLFGFGAGEAHNVLAGSFVDGQAFASKNLP
jgi:hypothetical protein